MSKLTPSPKRAALTIDLEQVRAPLLALLPRLEVNPEWYASIYVQNKRARTFIVNTRQSRVSDSFARGVVLRIFDGYSMFEEATDRIEWPHLDELAKKLVTRVQSARIPDGLTKRAYRAPTWTERLHEKLDPAITSQIPAGARGATPVHFGVHYQEDPSALSTAAWFERGQALMQRAQTLATQAGLGADEPKFMECRQAFTVEESLFLDREANLSQSLYRMLSSLTFLNGEDRTHAACGGLGGLECLAFTDEELLSSLRDLRALKSAERLRPGKYRVLFSPGLTGVLAHEAFGHSQEGDTCARGRSKAWDFYKSGELAGNEHATILNNPAAFTNGAFGYAAWGSYFFDEEGWLARSQVILDRGRLTPPMTNLTSALRLGVARTANGKREDWSHGLYTRQTNTYFSAGDQTLAQLMAQIPDGYLASESAGGMEDPKGMGIQVGIAYLKEVKDGQLTGRVFRGPAGGDIQMTGYTPDILSSIVAKSKVEHEHDSPDRAEHPFSEVGGCGKYHKEGVNAGCGGTYLLLDHVILG